MGVTGSWGVFCLTASVILFVGCKVDSSPEVKAVVFSIPIVEEEELVLRCAPWLHDDPDNPIKIQQNELVNLMIDRNWDFQMLETGIFYHVLRKGAGECVKWGDRVAVHYTGYDLELQVFDSSYRRNKPFEFYLGNVIQGWNEGLPLVNEGGRILLMIPSYKAYGEQGLGNLVEPGQHLIFDIELLTKISDQKSNR